MSEDVEPTKVATAVNQLAEAFGVNPEAVTVEVEQTLGTTTLTGRDLEEFIGEADGDDGADADPDKGSEDDDETTVEDGDDEETTLEEGEVMCQCGAVFDSKQGFYGHSPHCDEASTEGGTEDTDDTDDQTPKESEDEVWSEEALREAGVKDSNIEKVQEYQAKNGVCDSEGCPYGANDDSAYCISHQKSEGTSDDDGDKSSNDDLEADSMADKSLEVKEKFGVDMTTAEAVVYRVDVAEKDDSYGEAAKKLTS